MQLQIDEQVKFVNNLNKKIRSFQIDELDSLRLEVFNLRSRLVELDREKSDLEIRFENSKKGSSSTMLRVS